MSPQRKIVQGNIPQRRIVHLETRRPSTPSAQVTPQPQAQVNTPVSSFTPQRPVEPKPVQSSVTPVYQHTPYRPKLPSAAELAALSGQKPQPVTRRPAISAAPTPIAQPAVKSSQSAAFAPRRTNFKPEPVRYTEPEAPISQPEISSEGIISQLASRFSKLHFAVAGVAAFVIIAGVSASVFNADNSKTEDKQVMGASTALLSANTEPKIEENPISDSALAAYKVGYDEPRRLIIPKISVDNRILKASLDLSGDLKGTGNIFDLGWNSKSSKPGDSGATQINGYVHGPSRPGVFYNLKRLNTGDAITVERGDGKKINYKIAKIQVGDSPNTSKALAAKPIEAGKSGLNLVTYNAKVDKDSKLYNEQIIVFAVATQ